MKQRIIAHFHFPWRRFPTHTLLTFNSTIADDAHFHFIFSKSGNLYFFQHSIMKIFNEKSSIVEVKKEHEEDFSFVLSMMRKILPYTIHLQRAQLQNKQKNS